MKESINLNEHDFKKGDIAILDNRHEVEIVWAGRIYATIKDGLSEWEVMLTRLEPKNK